MENAMRTQSIMTAKEEHDLKTVFAKIVSSRLDEPITGVNNANQFVISRSPNYDGMIDVNFKRSVISTFMEATCLEVNNISTFSSVERLRENGIRCQRWPNTRFAKPFERVRGSYATFNHCSDIFHFFTEHGCQYIQGCNIIFLQMRGDPYTL